MKNEDFLKSMNIANSNMISETEIEILKEFKDDKWQFHLDSVIMGYPDLESQANGYFNGGDSFGQDSLGANLYKLSDNLFIVEEEDYEEYGKLTVFDDETKAKEYFQKQENILYPSIETEIENFLWNIEGIDSRDIEIEVNRIGNNNGYFVDYQVIYKNFIIEDGIFSLNPEQITNDINDFIDFEKELEEKDLELFQLEKVGDRFDNGYKIEIEDLKTGEYYEHTKNLDLVSPSYLHITLPSIKESVDELMDTINKDREEFKNKIEERGR